jgi:protein disulfide-isomerase
VYQDAKNTIYPSIGRSPVASPRRIENRQGVDVGRTAIQRPPASIVQVIRSFPLPAICLILGCLLSGCKTGGNSSLSEIPKLTPTPLKISQVWYDSLDAAMQESAATGKPILVNFTGSDWCSFCVKLKKEVFETDAFGSWAEEKVVLVSLDYPRRAAQPAQIQERNQTLQKTYGVQSFPTNLFLDSTGNVIGRGPGYQADPQTWIQQAEEVLARAK